MYFIFKSVFITFYIKDHYTIRMFSRLIIIKLFYNVIFLFITTLIQDIFIVYCFIYICIFEFYYLYVCTFMAIGNTSLMLLSINYKLYEIHIVTHLCTITQNRE